MQFRVFIESCKYFGLLSIRVGRYLPHPRRTPLTRLAHTRLGCRCSRAQRVWTDRQRCGHLGGQHQPETHQGDSRLRWQWRLVRLDKPVSAVHQRPRSEQLHLLDEHQLLHASHHQHQVQRAAGRLIAARHLGRHLCGHRFAVAHSTGENWLALEFFHRMPMPP